jgi:hypothetical protein
MIHAPQTASVPIGTKVEFQGPLVLWASDTMIAQKRGAWYSGTVAGYHLDLAAKTVMEIWLAPAGACTCGQGQPDIFSAKPPLSSQHRVGCPGIHPVVHILDYPNPAHFRKVA